MISTILHTARTETSHTAAEKIATADAAFNIATAEDSAWNRQAWWHYGLAVLCALVVFAMLWSVLHGVLVTADGEREATLGDKIFFVAAAGFSSLIVFRNRGNTSHFSRYGGFFIYVGAYTIVTFAALQPLLQGIVAGLVEYLSPAVTYDIAATEVTTSPAPILPWLVSVGFAALFAAALYLGESGLWKQKERGDEAISKRNSFRKIIAECKPVLASRDSGAQAYQEYVAATTRLQDMSKADVKEAAIAARAIELVSEKILGKGVVLDARRRFERRQGTDADVQQNDVEIQQLEADIAQLEARKFSIPGLVQTLCRRTP